ncbi:MAG TPA: hydrogenase maturation nickel metallochaperone HypA [Gammaproteobacteria bacterium]|nr:hydrogenase maturation nickel metallochaperone HypA [Gammaproteobacteria bacterium]HRF43959.1 hydrogenase maturation nickel metallochaperone HypA [Candidatus Competibacteraceae bacterium]
MHEMALAESILNIVEETARNQAATRVTGLRLEIGELANVESEALQFCLDVVLRGSLADGAQVEILTIPGQGQCLECGAIVRLSTLYDPCPQCDGYPVRPAGGQEMRVKDIRVE